MLPCDTLLLTRGVGVGWREKRTRKKKFLSLHSEEKAVLLMGQKDYACFTISLTETAQFLSFAKKKGWHVSLRELFAQVWEI